MSRLLFRHLPNTITCLNLFCGCLSVIHSFSGMLYPAVWFILAAAVFDFLDGFAARMLNVHSAIGKELDSLADMVSFGVAPSSIMHALLLSAAARHGLPADAYTGGWFIAAGAYVIAVFSALRLARFNVDTRQSDSFIGLPTPATAIFVCSLPFISSGAGQLAPLAGNICVLLAVTVFFSLIMVSPIPLFSLKFKTFRWKGNETRYCFAAFSVPVLLALHWAGLALVILAYIALSIFINILRRGKVST